MSMPLLTYLEAAEQLQLYIQELPHLDHPTESLPLHAAAGRVLATGITADRDQPPFPRSTRDGYACRASEAHQLLAIAGHTRAGETPGGSLIPGHAWEIMTGAPVPDGADCVVMVEHVEQTGESIRLQPSRTIRPGDNIVSQGAEARAGDLLIPSGIRIGPAQIALAAQCGLSHLIVAARPRVAILATGDELVPVEATPGPSQIRNSNAPMLAALAAEAGGEPLILPVAHDNHESVSAALAQALELNPDLLLISGGISAGKFDLVEDGLTRLGANFLFSGVAIQPGKPIVFGQIPGTSRQDQAVSQEAANTNPGQIRRPLPFFALPGNPVSSAVTFHLFAAPLLAALAQDSRPQPRFAKARLGTPWKGSPGLTRFLPARCDFRSGEPETRLVPWQGSGDIAAFARANCFAVIPPEAGEVVAGSSVAILLI